MKTLVIIPSRLSARRLPGKPLLKINGLSMISHVYKKAVAANIGEVYVAAEDQEIIDDVKQNGGQAVLTSAKHKTGTDRIYEAINKMRITNVDWIMNLQGDEPLIDINDIKILSELMIKNNSQMGTLGSKVNDKAIYQNENFVKVITKESLKNFNFSEAVNFKRKTSDLSNNTYHHLGVYCYQLETLKKFVSLKQSPTEIENKLEQLRALENGIKINVALAKTASVGVDTKEDLVAIKKIMEYKS